MALSFNLNSEKEISLEDFIKHADKHIDPRDPMSLLNCREELQMLTNNQYFVTDFINKELENLYNFHNANNKHTIQSLILHIGVNYYFRLNVWPVLSTNPNIKIWQEEVYQTLTAHDHNFWFLTAGYFGNGYTTEIWEYDNDCITGYEGEHVNMRFLEKTTLPKGKSMLYRASKDIHTQIAPKDYSLSLNIMLLTNEVRTKEQFYFDLEASKIIGHTNTSVTTRYTMLDLAVLIGDEKTSMYVYKIAHTHELPHVRLKGHQALAKLSDDETLVWKNALLDRHKIVSDYAKKR